MNLPVTWRIIHPLIHLYWIGFSIEPKVIIAFLLCCSHPHPWYLDKCSIPVTTPSSFSAYSWVIQSNPECYFHAENLPEHPRDTGHACVALSLPYLSVTFQYTRDTADPRGPHLCTHCFLVTLFLPHYSSIFQLGFSTSQQEHQLPLKTPRRLASKTKWPSTGLNGALFMASLCQQDHSFPPVRAYREPQHLINVAWNQGNKVKQLWLHLTLK